MKRATVPFTALVTLLVLVVTLLVLVLGGNEPVVEEGVGAREAASPAVTSPAATSPTPSGDEAHQGFLYGRVTTYEGSTYVGRLRFGRDEEAFWGDYFNGSKHENQWAAQPEVVALTQKRPALTFFGFEIPLGEPHIDLGRPFMARFGDIASIEERGRVVRVTLKSGTVFDVSWGAANDFADGVRVWDDSDGVVDLVSWAGGVPPPSRVRLRTIEFLATARTAAAPVRLHGTVRTRQGEFSGFVQWDRQASVATDELDGRTADGPLELRFDNIRSIARRSSDSSLVALVDDREIVLSGTRGAGEGNRGIYVDDPRYGRVLVSWDAFERIDFDAAGSGPAYTDFPPGRALTGTVTTSAGQRLAGRLVYDLDESETTDTLDAPSRGVDYTIPLGLVASIAPRGGEERRVVVTLHSGEELSLEPSGDLGDRNAGMLVFVNGRERPDYVRWTDFVRVEFDRPPAMYPPVRDR